MYSISGVIGVSFLYPDTRFLASSVHILVSVVTGRLRAPYSRKASIMMIKASCKQHSRSSQKQKETLLLTNKNEVQFHSIGSEMNEYNNNNNTPMKTKKLIRLRVRHPDFICSIVHALTFTKVGHDYSVLHTYAVSERIASNMFYWLWACCSDTICSIDPKS
jgi:hypothetical protein